MTRSSSSNGFGMVEMLVAVVLVILVVGAGVYVYRKDHKTTTTSARSTGSSSQVNKTGSGKGSTTTPNPYSDWKTYTSSLAGYTVKYPSTWTVRTTSGDFEQTHITSPDDFDIVLSSFTKASSYGANTFSANPTGACGSTCLASDTVATISVPQYGTLDMDAQTQGAGGGSTNVLSLYTPAESAYIASPAKAGVYTTFMGEFSGQSQQTLSQFDASSSVDVAELIYKSLAY